MIWLQIRNQQILENGLRMEFDVLTDFGYCS